MLRTFCYVANVAVAWGISPTLPSYAAGLGPWVRLEKEVPLHDPATSSWLREGPAAHDESVELNVALRVGEDVQAELERNLFEVSDPHHSRYGQYLSQDEVTALLAVPAHRGAMVKSYFLAAGASRVDLAVNGDSLALTMSISAAETALGTKLAVFRYKPKPSTRIVRAAGNYHLPASVAEHVEMVGELLQFPRPRRPIRTGKQKGVGGWPNDCSSKDCKGLVTPGVLASRYNIPATNLTSGSSMSVAEFQDQMWDQKDLDLFSRKCNRHVTVDVQVGHESSDPGDEAELDIEYIKSVAPEIPLTVIFLDNYSLIRWASIVNNMKQPPLVHSISYGDDEAQRPSKKWMRVCNKEFIKAGLRGVTIMVASGDDGVWGREGRTKRFHPDFPSGSPYITVVGGTDFSGDDIGTEKAWESSGGGFSNTFPIPAYQAVHLEQYKASASLPPQRFWNNTGRGYPDIAALGGEKNPYCVAVDRSFEGLAGTSASSPVVAGVFAKINSLLLNNSRPPLGFLNPLLYKLPPHVFNDVVEGINDDGEDYGFVATVGWDPTTGLGTPNAAEMGNAILDMWQNRESLEIDV